jgi:hypothetical protein
MYDGNTEQNTLPDLALIGLRIWKRASPPPVGAREGLSQGQKYGTRRLCRAREAQWGIKIINKPIIRHHTLIILNFMKVESARLGPQLVAIWKRMRGLVRDVNFEVMACTKRGN